MAFQTGTRVDPRLGALDFSGFTNAANIQAASLASLGDAIGGAIEKYNKKKEDEVNIETLQGLLNIDKEQARSIYKDPTVRSAYEFTKKQEQARELANIQAQNQLSATEEKINLVMKANPGLSYKDATDVVLGNVSVLQDPETGQVSVVNRLEATITPVSETTIERPDDDDTTDKPEADITETDTPKETLFKLVDLNITGAAPTILTKLQGILGGLTGADLDIQNPKVLEAQQTFKTEQEYIVKALRASPKVLATEMSNLAEALDISPGVFTDAKTLRAKMRSIDKTITDRINDIDKTLDDPEYPARDKGDLRRLRADLSNFQAKLGVPKVMPGETQSVNSSTLDLAELARQEKARRGLK
jgi:hypothetical protein|tara:strand:- start:331 stop:1410 length:1080 start_codon:yes stop_codon:yes gene_type:complete